jgi:hypothetical protein
MGGGMSPKRAIRDSNDREEGNRNRAMRRVGGGKWKF